MTAPVDLNAVLEIAADAAVQRRLAELARPEFITQRTVFSVLGMAKRDYLEHVRAGDWASFSDRRQRYSRTSDVIAFIAAHPSASRKAAIVVGNSNNAEAAIFARYGARRVAQ